MARGMAKRSTPIIVVTQQDIPSILVPSEFFGSTLIIVVTQHHPGLVCYRPTDLVNSYHSCYSTVISLERSSESALVNSYHGCYSTDPIISSRLRVTLSPSSLFSLDLQNRRKKSFGKNGQLVSSL